MTGRPASTARQRPIADLLSDTLDEEVSGKVRRHVFAPPCQLGVEERTRKGLSRVSGKLTTVAGRMRHGHGHSHGLTNQPCNRRRLEGVRLTSCCVAAECELANCPGTKPLSGEELCARSGVAQASIAG